MNHRKHLLFVSLMAMPLSAFSLDTTVINEDMSSTASAFDLSDFSDSLEVIFSSDIDYFSDGGNPGDTLQINHYYDSINEPTESPDDYDSITFHNYNLFTWDPLTDGDIVDISFSLDIENNGAAFELFFIFSTESSTKADGFQTVSPTDGFETFTADDLDFFGDLNGDGPVQFGFAIQTNVEDVRNLPDDNTYYGDQFAVGVDNFIVTVTAAPEPSSLALLGLGGFCVLRRRR